MAKHTITRRRTTRSRRRHPQRRPALAGRADLVALRMRRTWRAFWAGVEHPRLVRGVVLLVDANQQTPYPGFSVGHWLVVTDVSADQVPVADSSGYHIRTLSASLFHRLFTGIAIAAWQGALSLPQEG